MPRAVPADRVRNPRISLRRGIASTRVHIAAGQENPAPRYYRGFRSGTYAGRIFRHHPTEYTLTSIDLAKIDMAINVTRHIDFGKKHSPYGYGHKEHSLHNPFRGTTTPVVSLDNYRDTWKSFNVRLDDFDLTRSGRFTGGTFQVLCDSDLCACRELCDCRHTEFLETHLFCDGSFTQQKTHLDDDSIRDQYLKANKHNVFLKACGHNNCKTCGGLKEVNSMITFR
jgi:hypothetical protein